MPAKATGTLLMSGQVTMQAPWTRAMYCVVIRPPAWARGRKDRTASVGSGSAASRARCWAMTVRFDHSAPLGGPVVPDVKIIVTRSSTTMERHDSSKEKPGAAMSSTSDRVNEPGSRSTRITCRSWSPSWAEAASTVARKRFSVTTTVASALRSWCSSCSALELLKMAKGTAPRCIAA